MLNNHDRLVSVPLTMSLSTSLCLLTCLIAFSQTLPAPESGKGLIDTIQDSFKDLVGKQAEATASGLCNTGLTNCTEKCLN